MIVGGVVLGVLVIEVSGSEPLRYRIEDEEEVTTLFSETLGIHYRPDTILSIE